MILTYHDGEKDRAKSIAAVFCDYTELSSVVNHPIPSYNEESARIATGDAVYASRYRANSDWFGGLTCRKDAEHLIDYGWREGTERGSAISLSLEGTIAAVEAIRRRPKWGDEGDMLCPDRAMRGDWDIAFQSSGFLRTNGSKIVTIVGAFGGNCDRSAEELFWNGVQIAVVTDVLEGAGYQCEVIGLNVTSHRIEQTTGAVGIVAKRAGDPVRIDQLVSVFAHAAVFRTMGFEMICRCQTPVTDSLGSSNMSIGAMTNTVRKLEKLGALMPDSVVIGEAFDKKSAVKNIRATLHAVTGELPVAA